MPVGPDDILGQVLSILQRRARTAPVNRETMEPASKYWGANNTKPSGPDNARRFHDYNAEWNDRQDYLRNTTPEERAYLENRYDEQALKPPQVTQAILDVIQNADLSNPENLADLRQAKELLDQLGIDISPKNPRILPDGSTVNSTTRQFLKDTARGLPED